MCKKELNFHTLIDGYVELNITNLNAGNQNFDKY